MLSTDPALSEYVPGAPINDEAKKRNSELPGMGGVFNTVNLHLYHYAGNNPIRYTDPDGKSATLTGLVVGAIAGAAVDLSPALLAAGWGPGHITGVVMGGGAIGSIIESLMCGEELDLSNISMDALIGGISAFLGHKLGGALNKKIENALSESLTNKNGLLYKLTQSAVGNMGIEKLPGNTIKRADDVVRNAKNIETIVSRILDGVFGTTTDISQDKINP